MIERGSKTNCIGSNENFEVDDLFLLSTRYSTFYVLRFNRASKFLRQVASFCPVNTLRTLLLDIAIYRSDASDSRLITTVIRV